MLNIKEKEICVMLSDISDIRNLESVLFPLPVAKARKTVPFMPREYITHEVSLRLLKRLLGDDVFNRAKRIYFGHETCARAFPSGDIDEAVSIASSKGKDISLVVPYVGERDIEKIFPAIEKFAELNPNGEIIVNDFGIINFILEKNIPVKIVLGRLLSRTKRDPRFGKKMPEDKEMIKGAKKVVKKSASELSETGYSFAPFREFLKNLSISRAGIDALPQGVSLPKAGDMEFDLYWPWVYVTSGRSCQLLGTKDSRKGKYPLEAPCDMKCKQFEMEPQGTGTYYSVQKGNAVWMEVLKPGKIKGGFSRFVYEPVIPA